MDFKFKDDIDVIYTKSTCGRLEYEGIFFKKNTYKDFLKDVISPAIKDVEFNAELKTLAIDMTGFESDNLNKIFNKTYKITDWRIGEIVAEEIVSNRYDAHFLYNSDRDLKNPCSNQTGADMVGIIKMDPNSIRFLFGETKTSSDKNKPPGVMYSKAGMIEQLKDLSNNDFKQNSLVKWVLTKYKFYDDAIKSDIKKALKEYVRNKNFALMGVLVRDTDPDEKDLKSRSKVLHEDIKEKKIHAQLLAVYTNYKMKDEAWKLCL